MHLSRINYLNTLLALIPISFIAGNLIINLNIILVIISTIFIYKKKLFEIKLFFFDKLLILFFVLIILTGLINELELLDFRKNPAVAKVIQDRLMGNMEVWMLDKQKHMANLTRIQQEARAKGQYGVAAKCEELKGKVQGFYVERNLNINADTKIDIEAARDRIRKNYDREDYEAYQKRDIEEIFGPEPTPEERKKMKAEKERIRKEGEARMRELEKYQEDRKRERDRKLGLDRKNKLPKFDG